MSPTEPALFSLASGADLVGRVAARLGVAVCAHEERRFEDGECKIRPLESVRGRQVYLVQSLYGDTAWAETAAESVNDRLVRFLFLASTLRDAGAARVSALVPYLCYARKDRRTKPRDPVATRYVAELMETAGISRVATLEVHNLAAFDNAFRCEADHLTSQAPLLDAIQPELGADAVSVASPDIGGVKRAELFQQALAGRLRREVGFAFMEKRRSGGVVSGELVVGDVAGRTVLLVDDMIVSGGTLARAASAFIAAGAHRVLAAAAHGALSAGAAAMLAAAPIERIYVTDSLPLRLPAAFPAGRLQIVDCTPLLAAAIRAWHEGGSLVALSR